ncbi:protein THYLAKOID FORMATION1, chloroplastic-like [Juglans regia]|nr:protein THYLAKOID FORMATION1, chloroplastic-like [Juglans regia]
MRYKRIYQYDPVFALGFVTVFDQLIEGYPSDEDRDAIFQAYIRTLKEDPDQYRIDAQNLEDWAWAQIGGIEGEVEGILKDIAERARGKKSFSYNRFFAGDIEGQLEGA